MGTFKQLSKTFLLVASLSASLLGADITIGQFSGLNTADNPASLGDQEAQDLLNVNITPGGKSVYKRDGYGLDKTLTISTSATHGMYYAQDLSGSDIQLVGSDLWLYGSLNHASFVQLATGTINSTWQCTDNSGYAYCVTSNRDTAVRTSGTSATTTYQTGIPKGTMVTATPDRLVVSGVSGNESVLYFSQANTFTNFTTGVNSADPFYEYINAPGSRITHIRYACGKVLWWKDASFGYSVGSDQYNLENVTISQNIGTLDNSSDEYNGHVYFRGQDSHIYDYDCSNVTRLSRQITPTVQSSNRRRSNSWTQSTQSEFETGVSSPSIAMTIYDGSVFLSTATTTYTTTPDFSMGVTSNTEVFNGTVRISTSNTNINNNSFESALDTTNDWTNSGSGSIQTSYSMDSCTLSPYNGSKMFLNPYTDTSPVSYTVSVFSYEGNILGSTSFTPGDNGCAWTQRTISGLSSYARRSAYIRISPGDIQNNYFLLSGKDITFYTATSKSSTRYTTLFDNFVDGMSSINLGWYRSKSYDTGFYKSRISIVSSYTAVNQSTDNTTVSYQTSSDNSSWGPVTEFDRYTSASNILIDRYVRFISTWTRTSNGGPNLSSTLDYVTFNVVSATGTYLSSVDNASLLTSWNSVTFDDTVINASSITYYTRSSTNPFTILSSTPTWVLQPKNGTVSTSTGTYFQIKGDFSVSYATHSLSLNSFTLNWYEGSALDKSYIKYWNDYVWIAVSSGTSGLNNQILRWDLLNKTWLLDDIASNGFLVDNGQMYFGSPTVGKTFKYGNGLTTDNSGSINAFWKSKNFSGNDPFVQNNYELLDFVVSQASGTTLSTYYQIDGSTSTSVNFNLYDNGKTILHKGRNLQGKVGTFVNVQFGDNSSNPKFDVMGVRIRYSPLAWRPN